MPDNEQPTSQPKQGEPQSSWDAKAFDDWFNEYSSIPKEHWSLRDAWNAALAARPQEHVKDVKVPLEGYEKMVWRYLAAGDIHYTGEGKSLNDMFKTLNGKELLLDFGKWADKVEQASQPVTLDDSWRNGAFWTCVHGNKSSIAHQTLECGCSLAVTNRQASQPPEAQGTEIARLRAFINELYETSVIDRPAKLVKEIEQAAFQRGAQAMAEKAGQHANERMREQGYAAAFAEQVAREIRSFAGLFGEGIKFADRNKNPFEANREWFRSLAGAVPAAANQSVEIFFDQPPSQGSNIATISVLHCAADDCEEYPMPNSRFCHRHEPESLAGAVEPPQEKP